MTEVSIPLPLLLLLIVMAAAGFLMVMLRFFRQSRPRDENPMTEIPTQLLAPVAPPGYRWVLMPDED